MEEGKFPPLKWAQTEDSVLITIDLADCENIEVDVNEENSSIVFKAVSGGQKYGMNMQTFKPIVKDESKWNLKGRNVLLYIAKKEKDDEEWWPRISMDKSKNQNISIDWARWKDEDDEGEPEKQGGMGDFDPSMMQGMGGAGGGMPGMGGMGGMPGMPGMGGAGGMPGMPGMGGAGGMGGMDMEALMKQMQGMGGAGGMPNMADMMGGQMGGDSDDEEGEESQVKPHTDDKNIDDLDAAEEK